MNTNLTQNSTLTQLSYNQLWVYVSALSLMVCVLLVMVGNVLVIIDVHRKTFRTLTADLLTELLLCDMLLMLCLPLVTATSLLTERWIFGDTFCIARGIVVQIVSTVSYLLRMVLAFERLSFIMKQRGMKISLGMGLAVSFILLCVAVLIEVFPAGQKFHIVYTDGLRSCYLGGEGQSISKDIAVFSIPCVIVMLVSIISLNRSTLCKSSTIGPTEIAKTQDSGNPPQLLFLGSTNSMPSNQILFQTSRKSSAGSYSLYSESRLSASSEAGISAECVCMSIYESRATSLFPMLNIAITATVVIRLGFIVASQRFPGNETFRIFILVSYVISCMIQTLALLTTSSRCHSTVRPKLSETQPSIERKKTVINGQPFVVLVPRDEPLEMPIFLKTQPDMNILMNFGQIDDRNIRRLSMPDHSMKSPISVNIDRADVSTRRRVTISVL